MFGKNVRNLPRMIVCLLIMTSVFWGLNSLSTGTARQPSGGIRIDTEPPQLNYVGDTNGTDIEWELDGAFTAIWNIVEDNPDFHYIFWNQSGVNSTYSLGGYTTQLTATYDPGVADVGNTIYFQLRCNDTNSYTNSSIVFFSVTNTNPPTVDVQSPENTTYITESVSITLASPNGDLHTFWFSLYYTDGTPIEVNTTWTSPVSRPLDQNEGYYVIGYANDSVGLEATPDTVYFIMAVGVAPGGQSPSTVTTSAGDNLPDIFKPSTARRSLPFIFLLMAFLGAGYWYFKILPRKRPKGLFADEEKIANRELAFLNGYFVKQKKRITKEKKKKRRSNKKMGELTW